MRKFVVGAYWGGLLAVAVGLLPVFVFRAQLLSEEQVEWIQELTPVILLAGFALLTSVLAAGTMLILREIKSIRDAFERSGTLPIQLPARLTNWAGTAPRAKATIACPACRRTNWSEAFACVDCGAPLACDGAAPAH